MARVSAETLRTRTSTKGATEEPPKRERRAQNGNAAKTPRSTPVARKQLEMSETATATATATATEEDVAELTEPTTATDELTELTEESTPATDETVSEEPAVREAAQPAPRATRRSSRSATAPAAGSEDLILLGELAQAALAAQKPMGEIIDELRVRVSHDSAMIAAFERAGGS